jgi:hypothetical protein
MPGCGQQGWHHATGQDIVVHHLVTDGQPTTAHIWRLAAAKLAVNKQEVAKLEKEGIIHHSASISIFPSLWS